MSAHSIGGLLTMDAYAALAQQLQAEVRRLHRDGHSTLWIAESLRIDPRQIEQLLGDVRD